MAKDKSSPSAPKQDTNSSLGSQGTPVVDVENSYDNVVKSSMLPKKDAGGSRAGRRMIWTSDETIRLVNYLCTSITSNN